MFFFIPNFRISEFMTKKNKSVILRGTPCEKKFDNSIIRDKNNPCELRDIPCEKEKFDNSIIRDKNNPC